MKITKIIRILILIGIISMNVIEVPPVAAIPVQIDLQEQALIRIGDPFIARIHYLPFEQTEPTNQEARETAWNAYLFKAIRKTAVLLLLGIGFALVSPQFLKQQIDKINTNPLKSAGVGLVVFFMYPIAVLTLLALIILLVIFSFWIGLPNFAGWLIAAGIALILLLAVIFLLVLTFLSKIIIGYWLGKIILSGLELKPMISAVFSIMIGVFVMGSLISIPKVGWGLSFLIDIIGLGAVSLNILESKNRQSKAIEN